MDKFITFSGIAAPLPMINVDTDMIIPKQFLKTIKRSGLGKNLFYELRYDLQGNIKNDFVLTGTLTNLLKYLLQEKTLDVARVESTLLGLCWISDFVPLLPQVLQIFFIIIVSKMAFCQLG